MLAVSEQLESPVKKEALPKFDEYRIGRTPRALLTLAVKKEGPSPDMIQDLIHFQQSTVLGNKIIYPPDTGIFKPKEFYPPSERLKILERIKHIRSMMSEHWQEQGVEVLEIEQREPSAYLRRLHHSSGWGTTLTDYATFPIVGKVSRLGKRGLEITRTIDHPHLAPELQWRLADTDYFVGIAPDRTEVKTLHDILRKHDFSLERLLEEAILGPMAANEHILTAHGLLHTDVKPANILYERGGRLADTEGFISIEESTEKERRPILSTPHFFDGSYYKYEPYQVCEGTDVFSWAFTLIQCHIGYSITQQLEAIMEDIKDIPEEKKEAFLIARLKALKDFPAQFEPLLRRMLQRDQQARPTLAEVLHELKKKPKPSVPLTPSKLRTGFFARVLSFIG